MTISPSIVRYWANSTAFENDQNNATTTNTSPISYFEGSPGTAGVYEISFGITTTLSSADIAAGYTGLQAAFFDVNSGANPLPVSLKADPDAGDGIYDRALKFNSTATKYSYTDPITGVSVSKGTGSPASTPMFPTVADAGTAGDFKGLEVAMATGTYPANDPRLTATQSWQNSTLTSLDGLPLDAFDIFVDYDGIHFTTIQGYAEPVTEGFSLHNNSTGTATFFPIGSPGQNYVFNTLVPEPAGAALLGLCAAMLLHRRCIHQLRRDPLSSSPVWRLRHKS